jgi:hypothetical protein
LKTYIKIILLTLAMNMSSVQSMQTAQAESLAEAHSRCAKELIERLHNSSAKKEDRKALLKILTNPQFPYLYTLTAVELANLSAMSTDKRFGNERIRLITQALAVLKEQLGDEAILKAETRMALCDIYEAGKRAPKKKIAKPAA